jgi:hypothetical protein
MQADAEDKGAAGEERAKPGDLRRFVRRGLWLAAPLLLYMVAILIADPFGRFGRSLFPAASRVTVCETINEHLWRVIELQHGVNENMLFGGSKMGLLRPEMMKRVTGADYQNASVGGASVTEMVNLFWLATKHGHLRQVAFGVNVETINRYVQRDRITSSEVTARNPLLYLTNRDVLSASLNLFSATYLGGKLASSAPPMNEEEFWHYQLTEWVQRVFGTYAFDEEAYARLQEISRYCAANGIGFKMLILPSHTDVHRRLRELGLEAEWHKASARLAQLGESYDFDVDDEMTQKRENFRDPFHFRPPVAEAIIARAWSGAAATAAAR